MNGKIRGQCPRQGRSQLIQRLLSLTEYCTFGDVQHFLAALLCVGALKVIFSTWVTSLGI